MSTMPVTKPRLAAYLAWYMIVMAASAVLLRADVREEFHQSYSVSPTARVSVANVNGAIHVTAWDRSEVKVDAVKTAPDQQALEGLQIVVDSRPDAVDIQTKYPEGARHGGSVEYTISVPRQARLDEVKTVNGAVDVTGIAGGIHLRSVNGAVTARQVAGDLDLATVNGRVQADLDQLAKPVSMKTVNGEVEVAVPANAGAHLVVKSLHGEVTSDFALPVRQAGLVPGTSIDTTIGSGGPEIQLKTVNGKIQIRRR